MKHAGFSKSGSITPIPAALLLLKNVPLLIAAGITPLSIPLNILFQTDLQKAATTKSKF